MSVYLSQTTKKRLKIYRRRKKKVMGAALAQDPK